MEKAKEHLKVLLDFNKNLYKHSLSLSKTPFIYENSGETIITDIVNTGANYEFKGRQLILRFDYDLVYMHPTLDFRSPNKLFFEYILELDSKNKYNEIYLKYKGYETYHVPTGVKRAKRKEELYYDIENVVVVETALTYSKKDESNTNSLLILYKKLLEKNNEKYLDKDQDISNELGSSKLAYGNKYDEFGNTTGYFAIQNATN